MILSDISRPSEESSEIKDTGDSSQGETDPTKGNRTRVLLVAERGEDTFLLQRALGKQATLPIDLVQSEKLDEAIEHLLGDSFDAVLLDLDLPGTPGSQALHELRSHAPHVPVITLSAHDNEEEAAWVLQAGAQDYLVKGAADKKTLVRALKYAIERKRTEWALRESEGKYRLLMEHASDGIFIFDRELKCVEMNATGCQMLGYTREQLLALTMKDLIGQEDLVTRPLKLAELNAGKTVLSERQLRTGSGTVITAEISARLLEDGSIMAIARDVTERKRAEEILRESERKYRLLVEQASDGIVIFDKMGNFVDANSYACKALGYSLDELLQVNARQILPHEDLSRMMHYLSDPREDKPLLAECKLRRKDGTYFPVEISTNTLSGDLLQVIARDVTERKRAEEILRRQNEELAVLHDTTLGIINRLDANNLLEAILNRVGTLMGTPDGYVYVADGDNSEMTLRVGTGIFARHLGNALARGEGLSGRVWETGQPLAVDNYSEWFGARPGFEYLQSVVAVPLRSTDRIVGVVGLAFPHERKSITWDDIALLGRFGQLASLALENARLYDVLQEELRVRMRTELELKAFTARLEMSNRELEDFAHVASHDLQEPLRKISVFGDRLKTKYSEELNEQGRDYIARMQNAATRMQALINDLLAYSRITTSGQPFVPTQLNDVVQGVLSDLEVRIEQTNGRVDVGRLPTIDADPTQMRQLLQNLIGNALKFQQKGVDPVVRVTGHVLNDDDMYMLKGLLPGEYCQLMVEDNGIGFEEKYLDRIFGVFQRLHGRSEYEGTGVGLAVCRKIVERHGGLITAQSKPGEGARFVVTVPVHQIMREETA